MNFIRHENAPAPGGGRHENRAMAMVITIPLQKIENDDKKPHTITMVHGL
jgi:hypothetical protein